MRLPKNQMIQPTPGGSKAERGCELLPLNPDYAPISVAPHEGPEIVVVGEWVSSIDWTMDRNKKYIFGILLPQVLWTLLAPTAT